MSEYDSFYTILDECVTLYTNMLNFENAKYQVIIHKDITQLEEMLKVEQAMIMQASVLEKERASAQTTLGVDAYTLLEMAESGRPAERERLLSYRDRLLKVLQDIKGVNAKSMQLIELRLKDTEARLEQSGYIQDLHTYDGTGTATENNAGINKNLITKSV
ncbi:MAG: flagellar protein FlgN [Acetanaerobacterium sp.]